jgi:hypothetical protein
MQEKGMFPMAAKNVKWFSIPLLLIGSLFSFYAASYAPMLASTICVAALVFVQRAVRSKDYFRAAGLVAVAVALTPLVLAMKIFLLLCLSLIAACAVVGQANWPVLFGIREEGEAAMGVAPPRKVIL